MKSQKTNPSLTSEELKKHLYYESNSGVFYWKISKGNVRAGRIAGTKHSEGYLYVNVNKNKYFLHRLAWLYVYGEWPKNFIDHKNGKKDDNRIENLRDVSYSQNNQNLKRAKTINKSGFLGVAWHKKTQKWQSSIRINGVCKFLGFFDDPQEAHKKYIEAKIENNLLV